MTDEYKTQCSSDGGKPAFHSFSWVLNWHRTLGLGIIFTIPFPQLRKPRFREVKYLAQSTPRDSKIPGFLTPCLRIFLTFFILFFFCFTYAQTYAKSVFSAIHSKVSLFYHLLSSTFNISPCKCGVVDMISLMVFWSGRLCYFPEDYRKMTHREMPAEKSLLLHT